MTFLSILISSFFYPMSYYLLPIIDDAILRFSSTLFSYSKSLSKIFPVMYRLSLSSWSNEFLSSPNILWTYIILPSFSYWSKSSTLKVSFGKNESLGFIMESLILSFIFLSSSIFSSSRYFFYFLKSEQRSK